MASRQTPKFFAIVLVVILPAASTATEFVVGDQQGWDVGVNYTAWAENKEFKVGDTLVFKYAKGDHSVVKVAGEDFQQCSVPAGSQALESGNDVITLAKAGEKWYVCGKTGHCDAGQKLFITVMPEITVRPGGQAPASPPTPGASSGVMASMFQIVVVAATAMMTVMH